MTDKATESMLTDRITTHNNGTEPAHSDTEVMTAVRLVILSGERLRQRLAAELGIGISEILALGHLFHDGELTPRDLSDRLNLSSGTMTALVDRLEESGLAARAPNPTDRRSQLVSISKSGSEAMEGVYARFDLSAQQAIDGLTSPARGEFITLITEIAAEMDKFARSDDAEMDTFVD
ncbi:MAG: MarR family winged helix-turn-helix transcriptional regulator [Jatrophihabitans sp.]